MNGEATKLQTLRKFKILSFLTESQLDKLEAQSSYVKYGKGKFVYELNAEIKQVYLVAGGSVKLGMRTSGGKTLIKNIVYQNEIFGENVFTALKNRQEFAEILDPASIIQIPLNVFKEIIASNHQFAQVLTQVIIERLKNIEERMQSFVFKKAKRRIIDFIRRTGDLRGIKIGIDECLINHGMSHKEIAYLTDTSRQTVARVLGELKRENLIHFSARKPSKILIRDLAFLG